MLPKSFHVAPLVLAIRPHYSLIKASRLWDYLIDNEIFIVQNYGRGGGRGKKNNNIRAERGAMRARATHHSARLAASPPPPPPPSPPPLCQTVICTATTPPCQTRGIHFVSAITARVTDKFVFSSLSPVGF